MIKGALFILLGLFIDGVQAGLSVGIAAIAAFPGAAGGCAVGGYFLGQVGCFVVGIVGSIPLINGALATVTVPIGMAIGLAINICLSVTLGFCLLVPLLYVFNGNVAWKRLAWAGGEMIPGLNNIPFWTVFVVLSLLKSEARKGGIAGMGARMIAGGTSPGVTLGAAAGGVMSAKKEAANDNNQISRIAADQENAPEPKAAMQKTRQVLADIRPIRAAAAITLAFMLAGTGAQVAYAQAGPEPIRFLVTPEVPGPNERVLIEAQGVGTFLGDATITWQNNEATAASGVGQQSFSFTTGNIGSVSRIHVIIDSPAQGTITRDFTFIPTLVRLLWEARTSTPPFYRGKALYTPGSAVKVIALPQVVANGATVSANNLSFQWKVGGGPVAEQSGQGHSTFTFTGSQLRTSEEVSVDVYFGEALVGRNSITIFATNPAILFYAKDPLRGVLYDQALPSTASLSAAEVTLKAEPYYFAKESVANGAVTYDWVLNGEAVSGPDSAQGTLTLRQTGDGGGEGRLIVSLQNTNPAQFIQAAQAALRIFFGQTGSNSSSSFGI